MGVSRGGRGPGSRESHAVDRPLTDLTGSGIGRACALLFAKEGASGVLVADLDVDSATEAVAECKAVATNSRFHAEAIEVDITREDAVRRLMNRMVEAFGRIDYCVNCAGVSYAPCTVNV